MSFGCLGNKMTWKTDANPKDYGKFLQIQNTTKHQKNKGKLERLSKNNQ